MATELGMGLARRGHEIHFITYRRPARLSGFQANVFYHEVESGADYPLFEYAPYETALASKLVDVIENYELDLLHVHYAVPHRLGGLHGAENFDQPGPVRPVRNHLARHGYHAGGHEPRLTRRPSRSPSTNRMG